MINYALIGKALLHPTQREILEAFEKWPQETSPVSMSRLLDIPLGRLSYHVKILAGDPRGPFVETPLLTLERTEPRRGAVAHIYRLTKAATR